jgi:neutral ceramidase
MISNSGCDSGTPPPNLLEDQWSLVPGVIADSVPAGRDFGQVSANFLRKKYRIGEIVEVEFHAGCPRNNLKLGGTYIQIERRKELGLGLRFVKLFLKVLKGYPSNYGWTVEYTDSDLSTKFFWYRKYSLSPYSYAKIQWEIPQSAKIGTYRIRYLGDHKSFFGTITPFEGVSPEFSVDLK